MRADRNFFEDIISAGGGIRERIGTLIRFGVFLVCVVALFTMTFQAIMWEVEDQAHSWVTALYWTVVTMSTVGFGDIVFESDVGRLFSLIVLGSGIPLLLVLLPAIFIRVIYAPWLETRMRQDVPDRLQEPLSDHVIITRHGPIASGLIDRLALTETPYVVIEPDETIALRLKGEGVNVVNANLDSRETYEHVFANQARFVVANCEDTLNTNIALTVRELSGTVPIVGLVDDEDSTDILEFSGCTHVYAPFARLGEFLAARASAGFGSADVLGSVKGLQIAEFMVRDSPLSGRMIAETELREQTGANIVGLWQRGKFVSAYPSTRIEDDCIVVAVGTPPQLKAIDRILPAQQFSKDTAVLVIGAGRVGMAAIDALKARGFAVHVLDRDSAACDRVRGIADQVVVGDANERTILSLADLEHAPSVLLTTGNDAMNIYLTVYCRRLKPDVRIVSRITESRNLEAIHRAGADFAFSAAALGAKVIDSYVEGRDHVLLDHDVQAMSLPLPASLENMELSETEITAKTGLAVVAVEQNGSVITDFSNLERLTPGSTLILLGTSKQERIFTQQFR